MDASGLAIHLTWTDAGVRLALAFVAGALIGLNREQHSHPAGLRTTLLVCLAAAIAMLQADLLLPIAGKPSSGFSVMDLMRLPLGILTGMGFIGAGAVIKRGDMVVGVTTAATLWIATVIGLCFGGGQLGLGVAGTALTLVVLAAIKPIENRLPKVRRGRLTVVLSEDGLHAALDPARLGCRRVMRVGQSWDMEARRRTSRYEIRFEGSDAPVIAALEALAREPGVLEVRWSDGAAE